MLSMLRMPTNRAISPGSMAAWKARSLWRKRENRPVLLYWGAEWCPFCHTLKSTVFSRPDFIAKSHLFLPVYLDGDDDGAQKWGEQFGIQGYPTLIVLDADQHEIIRLGAGRDVSQYATILDLALDNLQPADVLLQDRSRRQGAERGGMPASGVQLVGTRYAGPGQLGAAGGTTADRNQPVSIGVETRARESDYLRRVLRLECRDRHARQARRAAIGAPGDAER